MWTTIGNRPGTGGIEIADVDRDGRPDILALGDAPSYNDQGGGRWYQLRHEGSIRQVWSSLASPDGLTFLRVVESPAGASIVVLDGSNLRIYDGASRALLRSIATSVSYATAFELADIDAGGELEAVLCESGVLHVLDFDSGAVLATKYGFGCSDLAVGQIDADPALEIALAGNSFGGLILDGGTLDVDWADLTGFGQHVRLVDVDHNGSDEVVAENADRDVLRAERPFVGTMVWEQPVGGVSALETADLDGDGYPELLYGDAQGGELHAVDETNGASIWVATAGGGYSSSVLGIAVADTDLDGHLEVVWSVDADWGQSERVVVASAADGQAETQIDNWYGPFPGIFAADVDADSDLEVTTATTQTATGYPEEGGRYLFFAGASHELEYVSPPVGQGGYDPYILRLLVAQIDQDAPLEVCVLHRPDSNALRLRCDDGVSHEPAWEISFPDQSFGRSLLAAELDADPEPELLVGMDGATVFAFEGGTGWLKWQSPPLGTWATFSILRAGDVLGDAGPEIVAGSSDYYYDPVAVFDASTGALLAGPWDRSVTALDLAQLDGDPQLEIVVGTDTGMLAVLDPVSGTLSAPLADYPDQIVALRVADVTRDGNADFVVINEDRLKVWGGAEGHNLWTSPYLGGESGSYDTLWVGNFDLDIVPEIAVNTGYGFAIFESPLFALFADGFESGDPLAWSGVVP